MAEWSLRRHRGREAPLETQQVQPCGTVLCAEQRSAGVLRRRAIATNPEAYLKLHRLVTGWLPRALAGQSPHLRRARIDRSVRP
jgi:hypothetical protein